MALKKKPTTKKRQPASKKPATRRAPPSLGFPSIPEGRYGKDRKWKGRLKYVGPEIWVTSPLDNPNWTRAYQIVDPQGAAHSVIVIPAWLIDGPVEGGDPALQGQNLHGLYWHPHKTIYWENETRWTFG